MSTAQAARTRFGKLMDDVTTRAPDAPLGCGNDHSDRSDRTKPKVQAYSVALPGPVNARMTAGKHAGLLDNCPVFPKDPRDRSKRWATTYIRTTLATSY
jgi:hypothetical protein